MSKTILIMGESGSGKTTAMRNLDPASTFYFDCDKKGLSWKGWRQQYNAEKKNYLSMSTPNVILGYLGQVNKTLHIKTVIVDTLNGIMIDNEMERMSEKGYDKWADIAASVYGLISYAGTMRDDLTVIFCAHTQTERDDAGFQFTRMKTSGRKLDKIVLESKFTTVLIAKATPDGRFVFETQARNSTAKSPMGCFDHFEIENDIVNVIKSLEEF